MHEAFELVKAILTELKERNFMIKSQGWKTS